MMGNERTDTRSVTEVPWLSRRRKSSFQWQLFIPLHQKSDNSTTNPGGLLQHDWQDWSCPFFKLAIPASPIASNYPLNEQWAPLAVYGKRAPLGSKLRGQHKLTRNAQLRKRTVGNGKRCPEPAGFSQLVLVLDLSLRLLLPPAVSSNVAAFLQQSTTSSREGRWLNLQTQCSRRMVYANFATTADWLTLVLVLLRASRY